MWIQAISLVVGFWPRTRMFLARKILVVILFSVSQNPILNEILSFVVLELMLECIVRVSIAIMDYKDVSLYLIDQFIDFCAFKEA